MESCGPVLAALFVSGVEDEIVSVVESPSRASSAGGGSVAQRLSDISLRVIVSVVESPLHSPGESSAVSPGAYAVEAGSGTTGDASTYSEGRGAVHSESTLRTS